MAHNVSNEYKQIIYSGDARNKLKLLFNNVELENADLYCERMTVKSRIIASGSKVFSLNNFISKEIELVLHDIDTSIIQNQVSISIGTLVGNSYEYVPIGIFNIQDTPTNDKNKTIIKLRDNSVKFDFNYNAQPLIDGNGGSATKLQILQDICTQAGVTCNITSFIGYLDEIGIYDNTITARQYIANIAEQAGKIATINRNGELIFVDLNNLTTWEIPIDIVEKYENGTSFKIGQVVYEDGIVRYETPTSNDDTLFLDGSNNYINGELVKEQASSSDNSYSLQNTSETDLAYLEIEGKTTQNGTPTYASPKDLISVGFRNIYKPSLTNGNTNINTNNCTITLENDEFSLTATGNDMYFGRVIASGTSVANNVIPLMEVGDASAISITLTNTEINRLHINYYDENLISLGYTRIDDNKGTINVANNAKYVSFRIGILNPTIGTTYKTKISVTKSNVPINYIPYNNYGIEIQTTNGVVDNTYIYVLQNALSSISGTKDMLYLDTNSLKIERKIGHIILNGTETWTHDTNGQRYWTTLENVVTPADTNTKAEAMSNFGILTANQTLYTSGLSGVAIHPLGRIYITDDVYNNLNTKNVDLQYLLEKPYIEESTIDEVVSTYDGMTNIIIVSNILTNSYIQYRKDKTQLEAILNEVNLFDIDSLKTGKILGNPAIDPYDLIQIVDNGKTYITLATNDLTYTGVMINTFDTQIEEEAKEQNVFVNGEETFKKWARTKIDNVEGSITLQAGEINEANGRINETNLRIDKDGALLNVLANNSNIDVEYDSQGNPLSGEVREVTTTTGFTFNAEGMTIQDTSSNFRALHRNDGTYYYDGTTIVGQYTKDGSKQKDLDLFGIYTYGKNDIDETPMFIAQLFTDGNGEEGFGHFYNRGD